MNPGRLNCKVDVYCKILTENELLETVHEYRKIRTIWAEIKCTGGSVKAGDGETKETVTSYLITLRKGAIPGLTPDMYLMHGGKRYDIDVIKPDLSRNAFMEILVTSKGG